VAVVWHCSRVAIQNLLIKLRVGKKVLGLASESLFTSLGVCVLRESYFAMPVDFVIIILTTLELLCEHANAVINYCSKLLLSLTDSLRHAYSPVHRASIPMGEGGHVPPIFMKGGRPW